MAKLKLQGRSVDVNDVWANVTCPGCNHTYDVQMKGSTTFKTCRCSKITISFAIYPEPGALVVVATFTDNTFQSRPLKVNKVYINE